ncbi:MAG: tyrosine-protein kinase family protein [Candidatus Competibacteraceae bacterium]|nr:tyrosine-protein kinase family protein [Candidatus Competibacteraceae bacterium]
MDSIEKAMFGRSLAPNPSPAVARPVASQTDSIERMTSMAKDQPVVRVSEAAANKRTQRSVTLDMERMRASGLLVVDAQRSRTKEEYRHIKRTLLMNMDGKGAAITKHSNLVGVTSARPGEGKTFTACNLALSIATERNRTVLLVDADILKPSVSKMLGFETDQGLVDFLIDDRLDLADVLVSTNIPALSILPAGGTHHLSAELLASENMRRLTSEMSQRYPDRIIIFDAPPLLATTEAGILANLMGQLILVVEAEKTLQSQVKEALSMLNPNQTVGFVLNKTRDLFASKHRSYDYGYQYARGGEGESEAR